MRNIMLVFQQCRIINNDMNKKKCSIYTESYVKGSCNW